MDNFPIFVVEIHYIFRKPIASYVRLITCLLMRRKFGNIVTDIVQKYENVEVFHYKKWKGYPSKSGKLN